MNLDMWFKDDIRNVLVGIEFASAQSVTGLFTTGQFLDRRLSLG